MQRLNAAPRDSLTEQQVRTLLAANALSVSAGCEILNADLSVLADISDDLLDGQVERVMDATIHGTLTMATTYRAQWGTQLARPYMVLTDGKVTARFNVGAYVLATPEDVFGETPRTYSVQGYDRLYLLDRPVGDSYTVAAGTEYLTAIRQAITDAGLSGILLDGSAIGKTLPTAAVFPFFPESGGGTVGGTTWLGVVNSLLAAIGYRGIYADENGLFRGEPYVNPSARPVEFTLNADERATLVGQNRTRITDEFKRVNRWVFVQRNRQGDPPPVPVEGTGIYTVPNTTGGLTWTKTVELDAADQASLVTQGDQIVAADQRRAELLKVTTGPLPILGHADVITYADTALGASRKTQAVRWTLPLTGGDCALELEVIA